MTKPTITELEAAFTRIMSDGYHCFVSFFPGVDIHVSIGKHAYQGAEVGVKGSGKTVEEAFRVAFANFPKDPLDGSKWIAPSKTPELGHD